MPNRTLLAFDNDGVLRDESVSYQRCVRETVTFFSGKEATEQELIDSLKESNDDWQRTFSILKNRGIAIDFQKVKNHFQDLYLGKNRDFTGYINDEPWLADNSLLEKLSKRYELVIISGAPKEEIVYTLRRNQALEYFKLVLGMHDCENKLEGLKQAISQFQPDEVYFCDDRPSPIKKVSELKDRKIKLYGILPPKFNKDWIPILEEAGALKVFDNVNEYCKFLLEET